MCEEYKEYELEDGTRDWDCYETCSCEIKNQKK